MDHCIAKLQLLIIITIWIIKLVIRKVSSLNTEYINDFEKYMITPYRLYDMDLPYDQFPGIYDIYLEFNDLKNGIMKVFAKELTKQDRQRTKTC